MTSVLTTTLRRKRHVVELRHLMTREFIKGVSPRLSPATHGWSVSQTSGGALVVSSLDRVGIDDRPEKVVVRLTDPNIAEYLDLGPDCEHIGIDPERCELTIPLDREHQMIEIPPALQQVRVTLLDEDGDRIVGAIVIIRSSSGASEPTNERGDGVYETAHRSFTPSFATFKVIVDGNEARTAGLDPHRQITHVHVIDTN
jgi:hypothetical protein